MRSPSAAVQAYGNQRGAPRSADLELYTLNNVLTFAVRSSLLESNPIAHDRPKFHRSVDVKHCREFAPASGDELHRLATKLLAKPQTEPLAWQLLLEAFTGCRTSEILDLRMDAKDRTEPGYIEGDWLWLRRRKNGTNPFALIHPALREAIDAHHKWHAARFPKHPFWIPHRYNRAKPANTTGLTQALHRICPELGLPKRTSHGLRAFYVTVRRSQGASDAQIAAEIGDATGATLIASTYGAVPPNWTGSAGLTFSGEHVPRAHLGQRIAQKPPESHPG
jgi:integrase